MTRNYVLIIPEYGSDLIPVASRATHCVWPPFASCPGAAAVGTILTSIPLLAAMFCIYACKKTICVARQSATLPSPSPLLLLSRQGCTEAARNGVDVRALRAAR